MRSRTNAFLTYDNNGVLTVGVIAGGTEFPLLVTADRLAANAEYDRLALMGDSGREAVVAEAVTA